jgi:pilus assembly protein CpaE
MRRSVRVIVFNADEDYSASLRAELLRIAGVQIVAEVDEPALIEQAVNQFPAEVLVAHLDPNPDTCLAIAAKVAGSHPDLAVFVISESTNGQHILAAMRAGIREFLTKPVDTQFLAESIRKVLSQASSAIELGTLISVMGSIGGAGASSVATNLAVELASMTKDKPIALVDLDFRYGQLGTMLDLQSDFGICDLCATPEQLDESMIAKVMVKHSSGVHLLARPNSFAQADQITAAHCASVLSTLQQLYEYVIVDGPSRDDTGALAVLDLADVNLLIMQLLVPSVRNLHRMLEALRDRGYNLERFKLVCNRTGRDSAHLCVEHVEATLDMKVFHQIPDDWKVVSTCVNMGVPYAEGAPKSRTRLAIRELAERIAGPDEAMADTEQNRGGLLGRIFSTT